MRYYFKGTLKSRNNERRLYGDISRSFTTSEMLLDGRLSILFHFWHERGVDVLRQYIKGFEGTVGSEATARIMCLLGGRVENAKYLNYFRKRLVQAIRAIPDLVRMADAKKMEFSAGVIMLRLNEVFQLDRAMKMLATKEEWGAHRDAFEELVRTVRATDIGRYPAGIYTYSAIRHLENQEAYLRKFLVH